MQMVAKECDIEEDSDWRKVTFERLAALGGRQLLTENTIAELLRFRPKRSPEADFNRDTDLFKIRPAVPSEFWESEVNVSEFICYAEKELDVLEPEEWNRVSIPQLLEVKGARGLLRQVSLIDALRIAYPKIQWRKSDLHSRLKKASQRHMLLNVKDIFGKPQDSLSSLQ